ncbi:MAG: hypothetical protein HY709_00415, partial [Candidatus Latescibacteria bacterium]|nr:hypothetical protein [Candidatus Latescibacterota bacterium]
NSYEGVAVYVLCEATEDIEKARTAVKVNRSGRIVVAVPREPIPMFEAVMNLKAVKAIEESDDAKKFSTMDNAHLLDLKGDDTKGFQGVLISVRRKYLDGRVFTWYGADGKVLSANPTKEYEAADRMMEALYTKRIRLSHQDLNLRHGKFELPKNIQLRDAVNKVLDLRNEITVDTAYGNDKGEKRYLYQLALQQALRQQGKAEGTLHRYQVETSTAKFADALPVLSDMVEDVRRLRPEDKLRVVDLCNRYTAPPYGLGPTAFSLFC